MAKRKYIEGQVYDFEFIKKVFINEEYLVFEDKSSERFLIPSMHYRYYSLVPGQTIKCLITRVDCSGKISFEPEHPHYKVGGTYDFDFARMQVTIEDEFDPFTGGTKKIKHYDIIVLDKVGFEHHVEPRDWQKKKNFKAEKIKCRISKIGKGHFQLINLEENKPFIRKILKNLNPPKNSKLANSNDM